MLSELFRQVLGMEAGKKKKSKGRSHNKQSQSYHYHYSINNYQLPTPKIKSEKRKMIEKTHFWTDWHGRKHYYKRYY